MKEVTGIPIKIDKSQKALFVKTFYRINGAFVTYCFKMIYGVNKSKTLRRTPDLNLHERNEENEDRT